MKLVYIVEDGSGNKKIGITGDIKKRMAQLKTAVPHGLVSVMVTGFIENARSIEKQLHDANKAYRLSGEWFSEVVDFGDIEFSYSKIETRIKTKPEEAGALLPESESEFVKLYTDNLGSLFGLSLSATNVLLCLASMADYESEVVLTRGVKERIAHRIGSKKNEGGKPSLSAVNNAITDMIKAGVISRIGEAGSGIYQLNPNLFARGKWRDIYYKRKDFKLTITYKDGGGDGQREVITEQIGGDIISMPTQHPAE